MAEQNLPGAYENPYKFNAKELDRETNLYYYGARYYNPRLSIWYGVDPLAVYNPVMETEFYGDGQHNGGVGFWGNLNPYIYTYQNPIVYVDPNGKQSNFMTYYESQTIGDGSRFLRRTNTVNYSRTENIIKVYNNNGTDVIDLITGYDAIEKYNKKYGPTNLKPNDINAPSAGEAISYVAKTAWESEEVQPILLAYFLAPFEAASAANLFKLSTLTKAEVKAIKSLESQIVKHQVKLAEYIKNPMKYDNKGFLKNAPNEAVKKKIIQTRINHLEKEIETFKKNIEKIKN